MKQDELFLRVVDDLEKRTLPGSDEYSLIRASGLLRLLLCDQGSSLVARVNRAHRLRIRFQVVHEVPWPEGLRRPEVQWTSVDPWALPGHLAPQELLTLDNFLGRQVLRVGGDSWTVLNVIRCAAHVLGGVHVSAPSDDLEARLAAMQEGLVLNGIGSLSSSIIGIGRVTVRAMQPLGNEVASRITG